MDTAPETLSKDALIALLVKQTKAIETHQKINFSLQEENAYLKSQVELYKRM